MGKSFTVMLLLLVCFSSALGVSLERPQIGEPANLILETSSARTDTLWLFASDGPGSYGSPGTDERGFTFDGPAGEAQPAGWTSFDHRAAEGAWWHLASTSICSGHGTDFSQALPFDYPNDPSNDFALWCGREDVACWDSSKGYGNKWDQWIDLEFANADTLQIAFAFISDFEGDEWDYFSVWVGGEGVAEEIFRDDTAGDKTYREVSLLIIADELELESLNTLSIRFHSDGAWSDEDGLFDSDIGAVWLDNLVIRADGSDVFRSDFEDGLEPEGLSFTSKPGAGDFAALYHSLPFAGSDDINESYSWAFFDPEFLGTGEWEGIPLIPYGPPFLDNSIRSPVLSTYSSGEPFVFEPAFDIILQFDVYQNLPLDNVVFYDFAIDAIGDVDWGPDCFSIERYYRHGDQREWDHYTAIVTGYMMICPPATEIVALQIRLGVSDLCWAWCDEWGSGEFRTPGPAFDNVRIGVVAAPTGLDSVETASKLTGIFPNPFNPHTEIQFTLSEDTEVSIEIYDLSGRLVRSLLDERMSSGPHDLQWNGKDDRGEQLASGVYFLRFQAGKVIEEEKLVLLK
ncbi:T9SS type A sorting domain-containing protein [bacterium]|nr:T9SS type A sorting domain-containing protein [bacterium]